MRALVTGGCGFIGSNLVRKLVDLNWSVDVVDNLSSGDLSFLNGVSIRSLPTAAAHLYEREKDPRNPRVIVLVGDFTDVYVLKRVVSESYDVIFHLAADPRVEFTVNNPMETTENNLNKSVKLMTHALGNVKRFVFSSTCAVYGDAEKIPTDESCEIKPNSPYALQKNCIENFGKLYSKLYGLDFISLRYFNVYGPNQLGDSAYSTAISSWCNNIKNSRPLRSDGDGTQSRDMVYVGDVVAANILAANSDKEFSGEVFNIGSGKQVSNNEVLEKFKNKFPDVSVVNAPWRPGDVMHTRADVRAAKNILGHESAIDIEEGLSLTFDWWGLDGKS